MITKRIIPCLDVKDGRVVKGVNFQNLGDVDSPVKLAKYYSDHGADELVFYDITASAEGRALFTDILTETARTVFIPLTVGGGINTTDDMLIGGLVGSLVGVLGGPLGVLLMGSYGMLAGSLIDSADAVSGETMIEMTAGKMLQGEVALIALVYIEGGYQFLLMAPDLLNSMDLGGLGGLLESGLGEIGGLSGMLGP